MRKIFPFLAMLFFIMLFLKHDDVFSQERRASDTTQKRGPGGEGSIWVNRDEKINGKWVKDMTPAELVSDVLLGQTGGCAIGGTISNVTFNGRNWNGTSWINNVNKGLSYFSHGTMTEDGPPKKWGLDMESGLLLTTSGGKAAEGHNTSPQGGTGACSELNGNGYVILKHNNHNIVVEDPDFELLYPATVNKYKDLKLEGAVLEFDFVPMQSEISFDYIFASEEYPNFITSYFDVFGFFIWEVDLSTGGRVPGTTYNIAKLPTGQEVAINTVNHTTNSQFYVANHPVNLPNVGAYMEYNGRTVLLKAKANVTPNKTYHLKMAIANWDDESYGSGVFLRAGSLDLGSFFNNIEEGGTKMNNIFEGCDGNMLEITFPATSESTLIELEYSGHSEYLSSLDDGPMPTSHIVDPLIDTYTIPYKVLEVTENGGQIKIEVNISSGTCSQKDTIVLYAFTRFTPPVAGDIETTFACTGNTGTIKVNNITGGSQSIKMSINNGVTWKHISSTFTNLAPGNYTLMITDSVSCDTLKIFPVTIHDKPVLSNPSAVIPDICNGGTAAFTATCSVSDVDFKWVRQPIAGITPAPSVTQTASHIINETLTNTTGAPITVTYVFTLSLGPDCTNTQNVTVRVHPTFSQSNPTGATIPYNTSHTLNLAPATGSAENISYLWQQSTNGTTWTDAAPPNHTQNYTTPALTKSMYYRRQATLDVCNHILTSDTAFVRLICEVSVSEKPSGTGTVGIVGIVGGNATFFYGDSATVTATPNYCYKFNGWTDGTNTVSTKPVYKFEVTKNHTLVANFEKIKYLVTLNIDPPGAGLTVGSGPVDCGTNHPIKANASQCYVFSHWSEAGKPNLYNASENILITESEGPRTLTAHFNRTTVNVTFNVLPHAAAGTVPPDYINIFCDSDIELFATPAPKFIFSHWEENGNIRPWQNSLVLNVRRDYALTAVFEPEKYNVEVYPNDWNGGKVIGSGYNIEDGTLWEISAEPFDNYDFINWTDVNGVLFPYSGWDAAPAPFPVHQNWTLFANFDLKTYKIAVEPSPPEGGKTTTNNGNIFQYYQHGAMATVTAVPNPTYRFVKWIDADRDSTLSTSAVYTFPVTKPQNLHAIFEHETYCIILKPFPEEAGWVFDGGCNIAYSDTITVHARAYQGWEFDVWKENDMPVGGFPDYFFTVTGPRTLVAHFKRQCFDIKVKPDPNSGGQVWQNAWNIPYGTDTVVRARALPGYVFVNWTEGTDTVWKEEDFHFIITYSRDLVAHFERKKYTLNVLAKPEYGGNVWENAEDLIHGTDTAVYAMAYSGFTFQHWETKDGTTVANGYPGNFNKHPFAITRDTTWVAHFKAEQYLINLTTDPPEGGEVSGGGYHDYLSEITITATPDTCYTFTGWFQEGKEEPVSTDIEYTFTVIEATDLVAKFALKYFDISTTVVPPRSGIIVITEEEDKNVPCGEVKIFEAVANVGYIFGYWTFNGTVETTNPDTITMMENLDVVANFLPLSHEIKVFSNSITGGTVGGGGIFQHNKEITVNAVPKFAHKFIHWLEEDTVVLGAGAIYTFKVVKDRDLLAIFDSATYTVTTKALPTTGGWTEPEDTTGLVFQAPLTVKAFANDNYTFKYWTENNTPLPYPADYPFLVIRDRDLVAVFEAKNYNITLGKNPDGGEVSGGGYNLPYLTDTSILAVPYPYYDFYNWTDETGATYHDAKQLLVVTQNKHFIANFTPKKYDIVVWPSSNSHGDAWDSHYGVPYGNSVEIHAKAKNGYVFVGWYESGDYQNSMNPWTITVTGNRYLEARFEKGVYNIMLKANPEKGGVVSGGGFNFEYNDKIVIEATPSKDCYSFKNWTDETGKVISSSATHNLTVTKSDTLTANFIAITSKITLRSDPYGAGKLTADGLVNGGDIAQCDTITIMAEEDGCHTFDYWSEADTVFSTDPSFEIAMDENSRTFVAHFTQHTIDVSVSANPPEGGTVSGGVTNLPCGEKITLTAVPNTGYHLVNWTKNDEELSTEAVFQYKTTGTCEVKANFSLFSYTITVETSSEDMGTASGNGDYNYGDTATVIATPIPGNMFVNWTENGREVSRLAVYQFAVKSSRHLVANFDTTYYMITVRSNDTLLGKATLLGHPTGKGKFEENETVTAIAHVIYGYQFLCWMKDGACVDSNTVYIFPATQNVNLVANFYALDFDTYAATLWHNTFMLDLKKLALEGYQITDCKWLKNNKPEQNTNTIDQFSYSAGPDIKDLLEVDPSFYHFHLTTKNGSILYSTKKILPNLFPDERPPGNNSLWVYPNPAGVGTVFIVENAIKGTVLQVYNQFGVCVKSIVTPDSTVTLSLNLPAGIYLIRNENKEAKLLITQ